MKFYTYIGVPATAVAVSSCKKEGCTDENALNYNDKAKKDNGTCVYYNIPSTYAFTDDAGNSTVDYSGQTDRLNHLREMMNLLS